MEKHAEIDFLQTLLPVSMVLFIIALGVVLLNQQFNKNLYRQRLKHEETKNKNQQERRGIISKQVLKKQGINQTEQHKKACCYGQNQRVNSLLEDVFVKPDQATKTNGYIEMQQGKIFDAE